MGLNINYMSLPECFPGKGIRVIGIGETGSDAVSLLCHKNLPSISGDSIEAMAVDDSLSAVHSSCSELVRLLDSETRLAFFVTAVGEGTGLVLSLSEVASKAGVPVIGLLSVPGVRPECKSDCCQVVDDMRAGVNVLLTLDVSKLSAGVCSSAEGLADAAEILLRPLATSGTIAVGTEDYIQLAHAGNDMMVASGRASGSHRLGEAIAQATQILSNSGWVVQKAKSILLVIYTSKTTPLLINEMEAIESFVRSLDLDTSITWGTYDDSSLGSDVRFTLVAVGSVVQSCESD